MKLALQVPARAKVTVFTLATSLVRLMLIFVAHSRPDAVSGSGRRQARSRSRLPTARPLWPPASEQTACCQWIIFDRTRQAAMRRCGSPSTRVPQFVAVLSSLRRPVTSNRLSWCTIPTLDSKVARLGLLLRGRGSNHDKRAQDGTSFPRGERRARPLLQPCHRRLAHGRHRHRRGQRGLQLLRRVRTIPSAGTRQCQPDGGGLRRLQRRPRLQQHRPRRSFGCRLSTRPSSSIRLYTPLAKRSRLATAASGRQSSSAAAHLGPTRPDTEGSTA